LTPTSMCGLHRGRNLNAGALFAGGESVLARFHNE
jgi:hypothetical protein